MGKITFANKKDVNELGVHEEEIRGADVNQIKEAINDNDDTILQLNQELQDNKLAVKAYSNGEGKTYATLVDAMAVNPLPSDDIPFRIQNLPSTSNDGLYVYYSNESAGYKKIGSIIEVEENGIVEGSEKVAKSGKVYSELKSLQKNISGNPIINSSKGVSVSSGNEVSASSIYGVTGFKKIIQGKDIVLKGYSNSGAIALIGFYDQDKNFISALGGLQYNDTEHVIDYSSIPNNTYYVKMTGYVDGRSYIVVEDVENIRDELNKFDDFYKENLPKHNSDDIIVDGSDSALNWIEGYYLESGSYIGTHATYKLLLDYFSIAPNKRYVSNQSYRILFFNKSKGFIGSIVPSINIPFTTPRGACYLRVCSNNHNSLTIKADEKIFYEDQTPINNDLKESVKAKNKVTKLKDLNFKNGKFRLYVKFKIHSNINSGSLTRNPICVFKNGDNRVNLNVISEAPEQLTITHRVQNTDFVVHYPVPKLKSGFGFTSGGTHLDYERRSLPHYKELRGKSLFYLRYKGTDLEAKENTLVVGITDTNFYVKHGSNTYLLNIDLTSLNTVGDLTNQIKLDPNFNLFDLEEYDCDDVPINQVLKVPEIRLISTYFNSNQDESAGTFKEAFPFYVYSQIDENSHDLEIVSDGQNCYVIFDGQNDGQSALINVTNNLNNDILPLLNEDLEIYLGGDENGVSLDNTIEEYHLNINNIGDAELLRNHRICSNYNKVFNVFMGHEMWKGKELDGIYPTTSMLPTNWQSEVLDPSIAMSTSRMFRIGQEAQNRGYINENLKNVSKVWSFNNKLPKKSWAIIFDDYEVRNYFDNRLRRVFDINHCVGNFSIERMGSNITTEEERNKVSLLERNGWLPVIHGEFSEQIMTLNYNELYSNDDTIVKSLVRNISKSREFNLMERIWVYASGAQSPNGILAMIDKGIELGFMINTGSEYYIAKCSNSLFLKRYNVSDKDSFQNIINDNFLETSIQKIEDVSVSNITANACTLSASLQNNIGNIPTLIKGFCYSQTESNPTIENSIVAIKSGIAAVFSKDITGLVASQSYKVRSFTINAIGINYGKVIEFNTLS